MRSPLGRHVAVEDGGGRAVLDARGDRADGGHVHHVEEGEVVLRLRLQRVEPDQQASGGEKFVKYTFTGEISGDFTGPHKFF